MAIDMGLGAAVSGLRATERGMGVWANDLANANTTAFAPRTPVFGEMGLTPYSPGAWPPMPRTTPNALSVGSGVALVADPPTFGNGSLVQTGNPTDAAILGPGFFVVSSPLGRAYTRNGAFQVDGSGRLVTAAGNLVESTTGAPITVGTGTVSIAPDGTVRSGGTVRGVLAVARFPNPDGLLAASGGLYLMPPGGGNVGAPTIGAPTGQTTIRSGVLQGSGTNTTTALVGAITLERTFQMDAKAAGNASQLLGWAATLA